MHHPQFSMMYYRGAPPMTDDDASSDPPSTRSSNDPPEHAAHVRSRSTAHAQSSPKRLSVFGGRSRSNTTTSTSERRRSPNNSMTSSEGSSGFHPDERTASAMSVRPDYQQHRTSRSFLARSSRILRRQGSKVNIVATLDEEEELGHMEERVESRPRHLRSRRMNHRKFFLSPAFPHRSDKLER